MRNRVRSPPSAPLARRRTSWIAAALCFGSFLVVTRRLLQSFSHPKSTLNFSLAVPRAQIKVLCDSPYFSEVAAGVHESLHLLGIQSAVVDVVRPADLAVYIIFTVARYATCTTCTLPQRYIVYNFEQLATTKKWPEALFTILENAVLLWDYSILNVDVLRERMITARHVPYGAHHGFPSVEIGEARLSKSTVFFSGERNERRQHWLQQFMNNNYEWAFIGPFWNASDNSCFGACQLSILQRVKVALNIHYFEGKTVLEVTRIVPFIINRVLVISEKSNDFYYDYHFRDLVTFVDSPAMLVDAVDRALQLSSTEYNEIVDRRFQLLVTSQRLSSSISKAVVHSTALFENISRIRAGVTFVIPSKGRLTLSKTLDSLLQQTNSNWHAVIVFDGEIALNSFKLPSDQRIRYFHLEKTGESNSAGALRNKGIMLAETQWVAFVDDDDLLRPAYVDLLFAETQRSSSAVDCVLFRMMYCLPHHRRGEILPPPRSRDFKVNEVGISFAIKRSLIWENLWFKPSSIEDFMLLDDIRRAGKSILLSEHVTYLVRCHDNSFVKEVPYMQSSMIYRTPT